MLLLFCGGGWEGDGCFCWEDDDEDVDEVLLLDGRDDEDDDGVDGWLFFDDVVDLFEGGEGDVAMFFLFSDGGREIKEEGSG